MGTRRSSKPEPTAGVRLIEALAKDGDPVELTMLIEEAGQVKDFIDRMKPLLNGDPDAWLDVKIGAKTVEVVVTNPLVQYRQLTEQLRKLIAEVKKQRAATGAGGPSGSPDPANV